MKITHAAALAIAALMAFAPASVRAAGEGVAGEPEAGHAAAVDADAAHRRAPMPFDVIRSLQFLQDQIARGNDRAIRVQALLLRRFGPTFLAAENAVWADPRNRRAAVLFVLSGGPPAILDTLVKRGVLPEAERDLFAGALAYVRNDLVSARDHLTRVDLSEVEPGLAAHIHLVIGQILQDESPEAAIDHLDQARLHAPGGLIEEAALRLGVLVVDGLGQTAKADRLARQYLDRYHRSAYAGNFEARLSTVQAGRGSTGAEPALATLKDIVGGLPLERRQRIHLSVARRALVEGDQRFAALNAAAALAIEPMTAEDRARAQLYELAARATIALPGFAETAQALASLDRTLLHSEDLPLLDGALRIVGAIGAGGPIARTTPQTEEQAQLETASLPVIDRAMRILDETASELAESGQ